MGSLICKFNYCSLKTLSSKMSQKLVLKLIKRKTQFITSFQQKKKKSSCLDISGIDFHQSNLMPTGQTMETFMILNVKHIFEKPSVCLHDEKTKHSGYHQLLQSNTNTRVMVVAVLDKVTHDVSRTELFNQWRQGQVRKDSSLGR